MGLIDEHHLVVTRGGSLGVNLAHPKLPHFFHIQHKRSIIISLIFEVWIKRNTRAVLGTHGTIIPRPPIISML